VSDVPGGRSHTARPLQRCSVHHGRAMPSRAQDPQIEDVLVGRNTGSRLEDTHEVFGCCARKTRAIISRRISLSRLASHQTCINWYAEVNKQNAKEILGLLGCPGLVQLVAAPGGGAPGFSLTVTARIHSEKTGRMIRPDFRSTTARAVRTGAFQSASRPAACASTTAHRTATGFIGGDGSTHLLGAH